MNAYLIRTFITICILLSSFNSPAQTCDWLKGITGTVDGGGTPYTAVQPLASATDDSGNVFVAGFFYLDTLLIGTDMLTKHDSASMNMYIAKYDSSGNVLWAKSFGGNYSDIASGLATDASGDVYMCGWLASPLVTFDTITVSQSRNNAAFITKLSGDGDVEWVRTGTLPFGNWIDFPPPCIAVDRFGNIVMTGEFENSISFQGGVVINDTFDRATDLYIVKYSQSGNFIWARGTINSDIWSGAVTTDYAGNIIVSAQYFADLYFDTLHLTNRRYQDCICLIKCDSFGNLLWGFGTTDSSTSPHHAYMPSIAALSTDISGNVYAVGYFMGDSVVFGATTLTNSDSPNTTTFFVKLSSMGSIIWAQKVGSSGEVNTIVADPGGTTYIGGIVSGPLEMGADTIAGGIFIASYSSEGIPVWGKSAICESGNIMSVCKDGFGHLYVSGYYQSAIQFDSQALPAPPGEEATFVGQFTSLPPAASVQYINITSDICTLYPNPATEQITISGTQKINTLSITNLCGQAVFTGSYNDSYATIDVSSLPPAIYLVRINNAVVRKFVKE